MSDKKETAQNENNLVEIIDKKGVETGVEKVLSQNINLIPQNVVTGRIVASAGFYISNRDDLMTLAKDAKLQMLYGVLKEAIVGCEAGLDYDIVPYKGKPTFVRKKEGWFKVIDLIKPAEIIRFTTNVVTTGDEFYFNPATEEIKHELKGEKGQKYESVVGAYSYIRFANGFEKTVYLDKSDLDLLKNISPSGKSEFSPWNSNSLRMVKTKATKELAKELFTLFSGRLNIALQQAILSDETAVSRIDNNGNILNDGVIYDPQIIPQTDEEETPVSTQGGTLSLDEIV